MPQTQKQYMAEDRAIFLSLQTASKAAGDFYQLAKRSVAQTRLKLLLCEFESLHRQVEQLAGQHSAAQTCRWAGLGYRHAESLLQAPIDELLATLIALEGRQKREQLFVLSQVNNQDTKHALSAQTAWLQMLMDRLKQYRSMHET